MNGKESKEEAAVETGVPEEETSVKQDIISQDKISSHADEAAPASLLKDNGKDEITHNDKNEIQDEIHEKQSQGIVVTVKDLHAYLRYVIFKFLNFLNVNVK